MKGKISNNKGITLIALIITIVVLLILAVVAIGQAQETNIVGYAQNAASRYEEAKTNEVSLLDRYENQIENIMNSGKKYQGANGVIIVWKANNAITVYYQGEVMFDNLQAKEIPIPSDEKNPEAYSKFFEVNVDGEVKKIGLSKDESVIIVEDLGTLYEIKDDKNKTYPRAYMAEGDGIFLGVIVLSQSFDQGIAVMGTDEGEAVAKSARIVDCTDIKQLKSEYRNFKIEDNARIPYSKAMISDDGQPSFLYFPSVDAWTLLGTSSESGILCGFTINEPVMMHKQLSKDQINQYIEMANK